MCANAPGETVYESFLCAACRTFGDEALAEWYLPTIELSDACIQVAMCGRRKGSSDDVMRWEQGEAIKYDTHDLSVHGLFHGRSNPTANRIVASALSARCRDQRLPVRAVFIVELIRRAVALLDQKRSSEGIIEQMAEVIESIKARDRALYLNLFIWVGEAPKSFTQLFMDSFHERLHVAVEHILEPRAVHESSTWDRLFTFDKSCSDRWQVEFPVFPFTDNAKVQRVMTVWANGLSPGKGYSSIALELDRAARGE
jgi:hypothetical protein